ncbi:FAD-binding oxidoreductase [Actinacidiphila guanduensis]|uniref:FAD/FMN-containing dehydrogenase n=1 Tax=Actinacidiphila guanduensis TaxID=310781 RepID=A0A1H0H0B0_9ACTN|nr:FAD-binding protein [Actinacidiphila guanduensis]SDO12492.1 FAD/FMN-containing dehydrogenase [Actinacidiphila guanduensis]
MTSPRTPLGARAEAPAVPAGGTRVPWARLARHLQGRLVRPGDSSYALAAQLELGNFDHVRPQAVAYCTSAQDVSLALRFAQDHALAPAVRSGGHSYGGYSTGGGLLVDVSGLDSVTVGEGAVDLGPGAMNVDILTALAPHGLVVSEGGCATVAAGGFLQGGGFGFLTRPTGMACDALTSAEVVLADGRTVTASPTAHSDLFWAIRGGGGGNFGVVTRFTVTPQQGDGMLMANLVFDYDAAPRVLHGVAGWLVDAPRSIGGGAYVVHEDAAPGTVPAVNVMLASRGTPEEFAAQTERLLALTGAPLARQGGAMTYRQLMMLVFAGGTLTAEECRRAGKSPTGRLPRPAFALERSRFASAPFGEADWADVMTAFDAGRRAGQARYLDLHFFGGAANDPARTDTAYVHRDALFAVNYRVFVNDPAEVTAEGTEAARRWADGGFATIDPLSSKESYQNWMDPDLADWRESYYAENLPRLAAVKAAYDPHGLFAFRQGITAA